MDQLNKNEVLNDDILVLLLSRLSIGDLIRLQPVSNQFLQCISIVLRNQRELCIGSVPTQHSVWSHFQQQVFVGIDLQHLQSVNITPSMSHYLGLDLSVSFDRRSTLDTVLVQHLNVRTISLVRLCVDFEAIHVVTDRCQHLERLNLIDVSIRKAANKTPKMWANVLSNLKHVSIIASDRVQSQDTTFMADIVRELSLLKSMAIWAPRIQPSLVAECLPATVRRLELSTANLDTNSLNNIIKKCVKITELSVLAKKGGQLWALHSHWRKWFVIICNGLPKLRNLTIELGKLSVQEFSQNIAKLEELSYLKIISTRDNRMPFDTLAMETFIKHPMPWRRLVLDGVSYSPKMWSNMSVVLPEVRRLAIYRLGNTHSYHKCMQCVVKLPKLQTLIIGQGVFRPTFRTLHLFVELRVLQIELSFHGLKDLNRFVTQSLAKTGHFYLLLMPGLDTQLMAQIRRQHKQVPDNVCIGQITNAQHLMALRR